MCSGADTTTDIWGKSVILAYAPQAGEAQMENLSYGYTYVLHGYPMVAMPRWDASTRSHLYGVDYCYKSVIAGKTSSYLLTNVVAEERMMHEKQTYEVIYTVEHNGILYKKGSEISLSTEEAVGLLTCDAISKKTKPTPKPAAKPSTKPAAKPTPEQEVASAQPAAQGRTPSKTKKG